jgi:hypothetical protein
MFLSHKLSSAFTDQNGSSLLYLKDTVKMRNYALYFVFREYTVRICVETPTVLRFLVAFLSPSR